MSGASCTQFLCKSQGLPPNSALLLRCGRSSAPASAVFSCPSQPDSISSNIQTIHLDQSNAYIKQSKLDSHQPYREKQNPLYAVYFIQASPVNNFQALNSCAEEGSHSKTFLVPSNQRVFLATSKQFNNSLRSVQCTSNWTVINPAEKNGNSLYVVYFIQASSYMNASHTNNFKALNSSAEEGSHSKNLWYQWASHNCN